MRAWSQTFTRPKDVEFSIHLSEFVQLQKREGKKSKRERKETNRTEGSKRFVQD